MTETDAEIAYLDLDLRFEQLGRRYTLHLDDPLGGQLAVDLSLPAQAMSPDYYLWPRNWGATAEAAPAPDLETVTRFGRQLFAAITDSAVGQAIERALAWATENDARLRLRLDLAAAPALSDVPWEYLYHPQAGNGFFYSLSERTPLIRFQPRPDPLSPLPVELPLRVLVMIADTPGSGGIDAGREWTLLQRALRRLVRHGLIHLEKLAQPTVHALAAKLRSEPYHIFHLIGPAGPGAAKPTLRLPFKTTTPPQAISGGQLGQILRGSKTLRLALLTVHAAPSPDHRPPPARLARQCVRAGVPGVLAWPFDMARREAIKLLYTVYWSLACRYRPEIALIKARRLIFQEDDLAWGRPIYCTAVRDGRLFDVRAARPAQRRRRTIDHTYADAVTAYAAREWAVAAGRLQAILRRDPTHPEAAALRSRLEREQQDGTVGLAARLALMQQQDGRVKQPAGGLLRPSDLQKRAYIALGKGDIPTTIRHLEMLLSLDPDDRRAAAVLRHLQQQPRLIALYARGLSHYRAGRLKEALRYLSEVRALQPDYQQVDRFLPALESHLRQQQAVDSLYDELHDGVLAEAARLYRAGRLDEALTQLEYLNTSGRGDARAASLIRAIERKRRRLQAIETRRAGPTIPGVGLLVGLIAILALLLIVGLVLVGLRFGIDILP